MEPAALTVISSDIFVAQRFSFISQVKVILNLTANLAPDAMLHQIPLVLVAEVVHGNRCVPVSFQKRRCRLAWPNSVEERHLGFFFFFRRDSCLFVYLHGRSQATVASRDTHEGAGCTCRGLVLRASTWYLSKAVKASAPLPALPGIPSDANWTFHLSILKRLVLRSAASDANGWVLSWHFLHRMAHVT